MDYEQEKCVLVIDDSLPRGVLANAAAICGITLGKALPEAVGPDVTDQSGNAHLGIVALPIPVLKAGPETLRAIRERLYQPDFAPVTVVDFSDVAQGCRTYEEFQKKAASTPEADLNYLGLGLCGPKKLVNQLTGSLPLLR